MFRYDLEKGNQLIKNVGMIEISQNGRAIIKGNKLYTVCHKDCITVKQFLRKDKCYFNFDFEKYKKVTEAIEENII